MPNNNENIYIQNKDVQANELATATSIAEHINIDIPPIVYTYSILAFGIVIASLFILWNILKKRNLNNGDRQKSAQKQIDKIIKNKNKNKKEVVITNKLDTPSTLKECIKSFLERTK